MVLAGEAVKYGMCQTQCLQIQPVCNAWCKRIGYLKGGECIEKLNRTAVVESSLLPLHM